MKNGKKVTEIVGTAEAENNQSQIQFEALYDDIYEITLPSTLWGIHRDLDKEFIVFSEFNLKSMATTKLLYLDARCECKFTVDNVLRKAEKLKLSELSTENIERLLTKFDENLLDLS